MSALYARWPLRYVWLGASVEDQDTANQRIPVLLETPAAVRWVSAEPLLGPITVFDLDGPVDAREGMDPGLHWVVGGGEGRRQDPRRPRLGPDAGCPGASRPLNRVTSAV